MRTRDSDARTDIARRLDARASPREFLAQYRARFGFHVVGRAIVIDTIGVTAISPRPTGQRRLAPSWRRARPALKQSHGADLVLRRPVAEHPISFERERYGPVTRIKDPAIICGRNTTMVVERGWRARLTAADNLSPETRPAAARRRRRCRPNADPVLLEIFNNLFMSIAEQMGVTLANTASSVNIKRAPGLLLRAVTMRQGQLIANAPHMPVHLGSMGEDPCRKSCGGAAAIFSRVMHTR